MIAKRKGVVARGVGSVEQRREPMDKKRMGGIRCGRAANDREAHTSRAVVVNSAVAR